MTVSENLSSGSLPHIPGYTIVEQLYQGTRTTVYRAVESAQNQSVVIKVLCEYPSFSELVQFRNQYTIAQNLSISGVVRPLCLESISSGYALVMEDVGGISLARYLHQHVLQVSEVLEIALQMADILHDLGKHRVVHKDIKPANILIQPDSKQIKLIDFSIASLLPRETQEIQNPNVLEGTLAYLAPEQTGRMNRGIDYRADFYALGVTLYQLLSGRLPFEASDPSGLVHCHIAKLPVPVNQVNAGVPTMVARIVAKLMAKNAEDRYQSARGLKQDLEQCLIQWEETGAISEFELGQRDLRDRFVISEKLYGREQEVASLLAAFKRVSGQSAGVSQHFPTTEDEKTQHPGQSELMLIAGFSGIGKTAVINEVQKPIVQQHGYFIQGKYDQFNRNIPLSAFVQALRDLIRQLLSESDEQLVQWQTQILAAVGDSGQVLIEVIPELEQVIGKQPPVPELSGSAAQNRFNLLFQKFIAVFTTDEHPLVIFLDDLQWADLTSFQLVKLLMGDDGYLLILGAYRDNEVSSTHPLLITVKELEQVEKTVHTLTLAPLAFEDVNHLVADTLNCSTELARSLSETINLKTQGNPFFTTQFLKTLHEEGCISFNHDRCHWECNITQVKTLSLNNDVVEFMARQLQKLPAESQQALKLAACIGNQFDLATLAIVSEKSETEIASALWGALQEGLILPQSQIYKFYLQREAQDATVTSQTVTYKFLHDRVQQAAYSLIPEHEKHATHWAIGHLLLNTSPEPTGSKIFEIVNHLNLGYRDKPQTLACQELAHLNLIAGKKAELAVAYEPAFNYFNTGIQLLQHHGWQQCYELTLSLHRRAMTVSYFAGNFDQAETLMVEITANAREFIDYIEGYEIKILILIAKQEFIEALKTGLQALKLLYNDIPEELTEASSKDIINLINEHINEQGISNLGNLPEMTNPEALACLRLLDPLFTATYVVMPQSLPFFSGLGVQLSITHGNSSPSIMMYTTYGVSLCRSDAGIQQGCEFGELALTLLARINNRGFAAKILCMIGAFIFPWKLHLKECLPILFTGYQNGLESGTLNYTAFNSYHECRLSFFLGQNLAELDQKLLFRCEEIGAMKQTLPLDYTVMIRQVVLNLLRTVETPWILQGEVYDEPTSRLYYEKFNNREALHHLHLYKLMLCCFFENPNEGLNHADKEEYLDHVPGQLTIPLFYFYGALVYLAAYALGVAEELHQNAIAIATRYGDRLQEYAHHCPANFQHKYDLVQAEKYRVLQQRSEAIDYYDRAIAGAKANGYIHEEALANELAAKFYLDWGKERLAQDHLFNAYYGYTCWGAKAKVQDLEHRYAHLLTPILQQQSPSLSTTDTMFVSEFSIAFQTSKTQPSTSSSSSISATLDLATVLKASQTLSSEIHLDRLVETLLQIVLESAGADKAVLLRPQEQEWFIEAIATIDCPAQIQSVPVSSSSEIAQAVIHAVKRNCEPVVIVDAGAHPMLARDTYVVRQQPKSLLCVPILQQGKLTAILYLENRVTVGAFTSDRVELLNLLCAQTAISLENARLYQQAQNYAQQLEQSQLQIVQNEKMATLGNLVAGVAHEINNPIGFLNGSINNAKNYIHDLLGHLALYQEYTPHLAAPIQANAEEIDLDFLLKDFPKLLDSMQGATDRIKSISISLRTFSRADTEHKVSMNLHEGLESTLLILKYRLKANEHRPAIEVVRNYGDLPLVECFPGQLNQVFMNILANAIDMFDEVAQSQSPTDLTMNPQEITINTKHVADQIIVCIQDNGKGMSQATQARIFDYLFTTKSVGKGTGLGLAIARQIVVENHSGNLEVQSEIGQGAEFIIRLPI
ncbi:ATP-binding sensor histidine kinase [Leptolyngbya sp. FACHB-16]|uniref:trifunctional serine/threonine-protein kinase/ATP-binding protein/sensor histidine kinase n=1 Tax=unclassified Leptolyngbya TaxID=2650499 RepID=UPI001685D7AB|nr:ATP-binding sensor histidine kinase [Leptolyngbya sp. FACHB-16]MBD2157643.1 AAA family ATPase [Leptolyngbya sp. FACHB-16]